MNKVRGIIKNAMQGKYVSLERSLHDSLTMFAAELFQKNIIGGETKDTPTYDKLVGGFQSSMTWKTSIKDLEELCNQFLLCMCKQGGPAQQAAAAIAEEWKQEVSEKCGVILNFDFEY